jgi:ribosome biogenesis GTPase / thiamine phosphate phosphatase
VNAAPPAGDERRVGRVVASHGRQLDVKDAHGVRHACRLHGRQLRVVCGDEVHFGYATAGDNQANVYGILPRQSLLERLNGRGLPEPVVANLTQLVVVVAPEPRPDWDVVDRYLAGAEWANLTALIVLNKCDIDSESTHTAYAQLATYGALNYPVLSCSTRGAPGTDALRGHLRAATSVLVGQSGTGKSSLLNAIVPEARAVTQEISAATEEGRHTTTTAALHEIAGGGALVDSPGVRDYAPPLPLARQIGEGFREISAAGAGCRFADCLHRTEPDCRVRHAAQVGTVEARRYQSYLRLLALVDRFDAPGRPGPGGRQPRR